MISSKGLATILMLFAAGALADPSKHATHRYHNVARDVKIPSYHPPSKFETFGEGIDHPLAKRGVPNASAKDAAISFLESHLGVSGSSLGFRSGFDGQAAKHVYISQKINNIPVGNAVANVALNHNDKIVSYGSSFVKPANVAPAQPTISQADAIAKAEEVLGAKHVDEAPVAVEYFAKDNDHVVLTHVVQVKNEDHWYQAHVDAHTGEVINVVDFVAEASYRVVPLNHQDLTGGFQLLTDPADTTASPKGWHTVGSTTYTVTRGNNVNAYYSSSSSGQAAQTSSLDNFDYTHSTASAPSASNNRNAAIVNAFYAGNSIHDLAYKYGFTEAAYNFQTDNLGKGGSGNDAVNLSVQDSSGTNNANFATPPDGQAGTCRMYTWTFNTPNRDGALENDIVAHEFTHGITNRMTGGGTGRCLGTTEAGGMGEGWSDVMAFFTEQTSATESPFVLGAYVYNNANGIRSVRYSTNTTIDPYTYATVATKNEVHAIGEIWATALIEVYWALVGAKGFTPNYFDATRSEGNVVFMHLMIDALPLQPCNPTFLTARNAIIQADANRYGGANKCLLWKAFAKRGLGPNAAGYKNDNSVPSGC
jgi:extracellular elastinolytic metalloproteinase